MKNHLGLIILDGWGIGDKSKSDAIFHAKTPCMDGLLLKYPSTKLITCGENVGLPDGQMGNSEVGHLNIGAGRIVYQELTRINKSIREGDFFKNPILIDAMNKAREKGVKIHFMGLVSKGGVHSSQEHLYALCEMAEQFGLRDVFIHAFTDGRDCDPKSGLAFIEELEDKIKNKSVKIASLVGRYYAMDRDNRWERIQLAYDALVHGKGELFSSSKKAILASYEKDVTDEFLVPSIITDEKNQPIARIEDGDVVISFNFRTDRPREITTVLTQKAFPDFGMAPLELEYFTMTRYDATFKNINVIFEKDNLVNTLGEVLSHLDRTQLRIAETEKYPHVTFFFNGGREQPFLNESRIMVNSQKVATYDLQPQMSAYDVRDHVCQAIKENKPNFFCLNFANVDMVGHTGVYDAIVKAVETVDECLAKVVETAVNENYEIIIIADHGNADFAINEDGTPNTAHSLNPVPMVLVTEEPWVKLKPGVLADVAPTILRRLSIAAPIEMTGTSLILPV